MNKINMIYYQIPSRKQKERRRTGREEIVVENLILKCEYGFAAYEESNELI